MFCDTFRWYFRLRSTQRKQVDRIVRDCQKFGVPAGEVLLMLSCRRDSDGKQLVDDLWEANPSYGISRETV